MPAVKNVGEPCAGEPHARFDVAAGGDQTSRANTRRAVQAPLADPTAPVRPLAGKQGCRGEPTSRLAIDAVEMRTFGEGRCAATRGLRLAYLSGDGLSSASWGGRSLGGVVVVVLRAGARAYFGPRPL